MGNLPGVSSGHDPEAESVKSLPLLESRIWKLAVEKAGRGGRGGTDEVMKKGLAQALQESVRGTPEDS